MLRRKKIIFGISLAGVIVALLPAAAYPLQPQSEQEIQDRLIKEANKKRQEDIRNDTAKLFQLATELKAAVEKSNEHVLSLDVVRKADEVEKLAKRVKEKMKQSIGPSPRIEPAPAEPFPKPPK